MKKTIALLAILAQLNLFAVCQARPSQLVESLAVLCYECMFPFKLFGIPILQGHMPEGANMVTTPICMCPAPPPMYVRYGFPIGYYIPDRMIDVVKDPFCFQGLGIAASPNTLYGGGAGHDTGSKGVTRKNDFFQVHNFTYPLMSIIEAFIDMLCFSASSYLDVAYITEVDPLWNSDSLGSVISPESMLFNNPITNIACAADSIAAQANFPLDPLFWCKGSWGNAYPLTGTITKLAEITDAASAAASYIFKSHRQMLTWNMSGYSALCFAHPMPIWIKSSNRLQIFSPIPHWTATGIGQTGMLWNWGKRVPSFDNYSFFWFRKVDCCAL